jgi:hypothetical protein
MLSRYILKDLSVFKQLLEMGLSSYETFLDRCLFQTRSMQTT